ncbi:MAG TPA: peptidoglycan DD-metalloendopeptidase family protein [bacterium]|nr:peptidoglycan DD-metalloendopeptidase family protein [bacterium]
MLTFLKKSIFIVTRAIASLIVSFSVGLWYFLFKRLILPLYKGFLFFKKNIKNIFWGNGPAQTEKNGKKPYLVHSLVALIFFLVVSNNLSTRNTYAEELNKNSILAKLFISTPEEEIIERPLLNEKNKSLPKSETIIGQFDSLEPPTNQPGVDLSAEQNLAVISPTGDALINPQQSPFGNASADNSAAKNAIQTYEVQTGDTLSSIASHFGLSVNTLLWENNLTLKSYLKPGMKLSILPTNGISYSVKRGDTVASIAKKFDVSPDKILSYNNLDSAATIKVSQHLIIPDGKPLSTSAPVASAQSSVKNIFSKGVASTLGKYVWPSTSRRITQYFSWRHTGLDIGAAAGTPIYALDSGRVELAGWSSGYGYNIIVNHGNGIKTRYGHSRKLYVKVGDQVSAGEVLGEVGSTGYSTGPHIHLEIKINGTNVNPLSYL